MPVSGLAVKGSCDRFSAANIGRIVQLAMFCRYFFTVLKAFC